MLYSKKLRGFIDPSDGGKIPSDAKEVPQEVYESLLAQHLSTPGSLIEPNEDGFPEIVMPPQSSLEGVAGEAMQKVNQEYTKRMAMIAEAYPLHERESWPVQLQEANLLLSYAGAGVPVPEIVKTPWIDQCAHQRGMDRMELAARIVAKDEGYRTVSGFLSGVRQWHEDCIDMLLQDGEDAREALLGYDHLQGWEQSAPV